MSGLSVIHRHQRVACDFLLVSPLETGRITRDMDNCPDRQLHTDISVWITDVKILVTIASTRGIRVRFDPFGDFCRHSGQYASRMRN